MKNVKTISGKELSKVGIGSYGIGGRAHRYVGEVDHNSDREYIDALINQFNVGYNFTEISAAIAGGKSADLFVKAMKESSLDRNDLFITHSLWPKDINVIDDAYRDVETMEKLFSTECFDSTLITLSFIVKFGEVESFKLINSLLQSGRTKYISLSNSNPQTIQRFKEAFGDLFYAHEAHLSFEIRENQDKGIFDLCDDLGIQNVIWRPLRENKTVGYNWPLLVELSNKYGKTQNQIVLNWMAHMGYKIEVMSKSIKHIKENWEATLFEMEDTDYQKINEHRIDGYTYPKVDWNKTGEGISVSVLPDKFEENYIKP